MVPVRAWLQASAPGMLLPMGSTTKRREQLAEILAEGEAPIDAPVPASHAALLDERAALIDAGKMELIPSEEAHARLMAVAQGNLVKAMSARHGTTKRAAAKAPGVARKRRRSHARTSR